MILAPNVRTSERGNVPEFDIEFAFLGGQAYHCAEKRESSVHGARLFCVLGVVEQSLETAVEDYGACEEDGDDVGHLFVWRRFHAWKW